MIARYTRPAMGRIWSDENKYRCWLTVETAASQALARFGLVPQAAANAIRDRGNFTVDRIHEIEAEVRHDVIAFTTTVAEHIDASPHRDENASRWLHYGLTSTDVVDTAQSLQLREASILIHAGILGLSETLKKRALEFKHTPIIGRTHGVHAEPTTFGLKLLLWYSEMQRNLTRFDAAAEDLRVGKLSGAVGTFGHIKPEHEETICKSLNLKPVAIATQVVQRDRHAAFVAALAILCSTLDKIATEVRHLQRTEVREAEEFFSEKQKGSSAMPHKRNPITSEQISGLARVVRANAQTAFENIVLWHERDISHSSAERVILPDSTILADYLLAKTENLIAKLLVYPARMLRNLESTGGLIFSGQLLLDLTESGMSREDAYRLVQTHAMRSWKEELIFRDEIAKVPEITSRLDPEKLAHAFDYHRQLANVDAIFSRVLGPTDRIRLAMSFTHLETVQVIFLFLLFLVAVFAAIAQRLKIPYPILLTVAGLCIAFVPHVPRIPLDPDLVFLIFLPPLLYAAAWQTNWREFRRNMVSIAMLALGLVAFTVIGIATLSDRFIAAIDWKSGLLLGAVISTTDAISATALAKSIGLPQHIVDLLEGESLVNDATGLLALEFGLGLLLRDQAPTLGTGSLRLLWLIAGGLGVGLLVAVVTRWFEQFIEDGPIEMAVSLIVPYAAYLASEEIHASGVLAVVACGLYLSRYSAQYFSPQARLQVTGAWSALNFILNGLIFVLIGLQLPYILGGISQYGRWTLLKYGLAFSVTLILLRLIWMFPSTLIATFIRKHLLHQHVAPINPREVFLLGWTGMRGVVALAAAISLPVTLGDGSRFVQRDLIIFLTFSTIFVTVVVQGLTLSPLIRALGLENHAPGCEEEIAARRAVLQEIIAHLESEELSARTKEDRHGYEDLLDRYHDRLESLNPIQPGADAPQTDPALFWQRRKLYLETVQMERGILLRLRDQGSIGDDVQRRLEHELDLNETRLIL